MAVDLVKAFGATLRRIRKGMHLSQEAFGDVIGLHRTHVSLLERGGREPMLTTQYQIATKLNMTLPEFMDLVMAEFEKAKSQ